MAISEHAASCVLDKTPRTKPLSVGIVILLSDYFFKQGLMQVGPLPTYLDALDRSRQTGNEWCGKLICGVRSGRARIPSDNKRITLLFLSKRPSFGWAARRIVVTCASTNGDKWRRLCQIYGIEKAATPL